MRSVAQLCQDWYNQLLGDVMAITRRAFSSRPTVV